jgi:hypothetical protein
VGVAEGRFLLSDLSLVMPSSNCKTYPWHPIRPKHCGMLLILCDGYLNLVRDDVITVLKGGLLQHYFKLALISQITSEPCPKQQAQ